ncbi:AAA family ATPase [Colletotrichum musicola]|uniref:AAA family ATPase n=1 Tax=Colletotrichum musicola TaxID=2175873 RepID=A0A8H6NRK7_9PEZI|nr:AAA family ATPase [Colletotrichum musicola]
MKSMGNQMGPKMTPRQRKKQRQQQEQEQQQQQQLQRQQEEKEEEEEEEPQMRAYKTHQRPKQLPTKEKQSVQERYQVKEFQQQGLQQQQVAHQSVEDHSTQNPGLEQQRAVQSSWPTFPVLHTTTDSTYDSTIGTGGLDPWKGANSTVMEGIQPLLGNTQHHVLADMPPNGIEQLPSEKISDWGEMEPQTQTRLQVARIPQKVYHSTTAQTGIEGTVPSGMAHVASSINELKRQIQELQRENKRMKLSGEELGSDKATWQVFHCIFYEGSGPVKYDYNTPKATFIAEPSWAVVDEQLHLKGNLPISSPATYVRQKPNVSFVVYNYYTDEHRQDEAKAASQNSEPLPSPKSARQNICVISADMAAVIEKFLNQQPNFRRDFPGLKVRSPMQAPYMWWYQYRKSRIVEHLPPDEAELLGILTTWIDENYTDLYDQVDSQIKRGVVSYNSMEFLIKPGEVLVSKTNDSVECQLATSWALPIHEEILDEHPTENRSQEDESRHLSTWFWRVDAWSYSYDGVDRKRTRTVLVRLHTASAEDEVSIGDLDTVPLRFLDQRICPALYVSYNIPEKYRELVY